MFRGFLFAIFMALVQPALWAQQVAGDTTSYINLKGVVVLTDSSQLNESFSFYKSNRLATTEDILSRMQGVNLIRRGAYGMEPTLRNYGSGQSNISIDGMRIYGACTDKMDPVSIYVEPANLASIQVVQGSAGATEGSTIGGFIGLKLNEPRFDPTKALSGEVNQSYMTVNGGSHTALIINHSLGKLAYRVNGTFRKAGNYTDGAGELVPYSGFQKSNASVSVVYRLDSLHSLKVDYLGDWGKDIGFPALPMDVGYANAHIAALTHRSAFAGKWFQANELKFYFNTIDHSMDDTHRTDVPMHMDMPGWSHTWGFYEQLLGGRRLKLRLDFHRTNTRADMTMFPSGEPEMYMQTLPGNYLNDLGLAAERVFLLNAQQEIGVKGRLDYYVQTAEEGFGAKQWDVFNWDVTTQLSNLLKNIHLAYTKRFSAASRIQLNLGYGERIPSSNERYGFYLYNRQDQFDYIGNPVLDPERSLQTELVYNQRFGRVGISINLYYHQIGDYIYSYPLEGMSQMTIGAFGVKTYRNIPSAFSTGFECMAKAHLLTGFQYMGTAAFVYAQTTDGVPLPLTPPFKLQQVLRYRMGLYRFQLEHDYSMAQYRVNADYGDRVTPSYALFNLRVSRNFPVNTSSFFQLSVACENMFDEQYRSHLDIGDIYRSGRNFLFNLWYYF